MELTRQIFWSPQGSLNDLLHKSTYLWLAIALGIAAYGIFKRVKIWRRGKPEAVFDNTPARLKMLFQNVFGQARILRKRRMREFKNKSGDSVSSHSLFAAWMHGLIFYGFMALVFGTTIVALKDYGIVDLYTGWHYAFVTVACEVGGVALAVGLGMGIARRTSKSSEFPHELGYTILYVILLLLVVQGFVIEGFRLAVQTQPVDAHWSFVGSLFSNLFPASMSLDTAQNVYSGLWYFHMLTTMGFVAALPYSKAMHIVTASLNLYTVRLEPNVLMPKLDLENADAEYFGPKVIGDFTWKDFLAFDSCTNCRRCTDICPANAVGKDLDPRQIILKLRDSMLAEVQLGLSGAKVTPVELYEGGVITNDEIWACTNCGGCVAECPVGIDQMRSIVQLRRYQTLSLGEVPPTAARAIENIKQHKNPWGVSQADRFKWADGLDLPILTGDSPEVEYLYYVGCAGSYDSSNQSVARSVVQILKQCGVSFAVMGKAEQCNGEPVKRLGDEYAFSEIARSNVEQLNALKFQKIVTHCPHCFNTLKNDFKEYGGNYEVLHHTQLLSKLHANGQLQLPGEVRKDVTFHDPCFLGRHNGEYEAPRKLLEAVAGLRIKEMEYSKQSSSCCGMGGGNMWYESKGGTAMVEQRLNHVAQTGAKTLVTGCSFCMINFKGAFKNLESTKDLEVLDIAQAIQMAMPKETV